MIITLWILVAVMITWLTFWLDPFLETQYKNINRR